MTALPAFPFVAVHLAPLADGMVREADWLTLAARSGRPSAHLWSATPGFVVPRSYERLPGWAAACAVTEAAGGTVQVRASGGGLVPQGPGLLNLSLAWVAGESATPRDTDAIYREMAAELAEAFARLGIVATAQAVEGSFCDGRFNLAVDGRKLVGTAQAWRRVEGRQVVLAHAVIVIDADPEEISAAANAFEQAAGSERHYDAEVLTSVAQAWCDAHGRRAVPAGLAVRLRSVVAERFARYVPPVVVDDAAHGGDAPRA